MSLTVYRLRVFFVMAFFQMVSELNIWSGLAGQGHQRLVPTSWPC